MVTAMPAGWSVRGATFALWALAAACAVFWGLRLGSGPAVEAPLAAGVRSTVTADPGAIARLLGGVPAVAGAAAAPVASLASRLQLVGVVAGVRSGGGAAVIAVDGRPARPYRVGSFIEEGLVLQSVHGRQAVLAAQSDGTALTLELPTPQSQQAPASGPAGQSRAAEAPGAPSSQARRIRPAPR